MKTLISATEDSATYEFSLDSSTRIVEFHKSVPAQVEEGQEQPEEQPFDHEALSEAEYQQWLAWLGHSA
jgi:hypothetical protein